MLLAVENLTIRFPQNNFTAVNNLSFHINQGEILALVGESGSGKSLTALSILGLQPITASLNGSIKYKDQILFNSSTARFPQGIRGKEISLIPQDPLSSLNPMFSIQDQLYEAVQIYHSDLDEAEICRKCFMYLEKVGIPDPARCLKSYPHEISGGMRQRVMIAMAIINEPDLLIADEPTTALDVTVQALILDLLKSLGKSILFITHDLGVVAEIADRVLVLRHGQAVEESSVYDLYANPRELYTKELLAAVPRI